MQASNISKLISNYHLSAEPEPIGCSSDFECSPSQACQNRRCINPCTTEKPCSQTAICSVKSHRASCTCPPGFEGDPYRQCTKSKILRRSHTVYLFIENSVHFFKRRKNKQIVKDFENNLFQLKRENVNMILTALKIGHALKINVLTLASSLNHAEMVLVVKQQLIDRYVVVLPTGQEIHTKNAINVRYRY